MPNLVTIKSVKKNKINIFFEDNLIQTQDIETAVMAYDTVDKKFVNVPVSQDFSNKSRYIFYAPEADLFELFFDEIMPGYIKTLNNFNIAPEPSRYIGFSRDLTEDEYRQYAQRLNLPKLDDVLEAAQNG